MRYQASGAPALAREAVSLLNDAGMPAGTAANRGLDHGAWVPLMLMCTESQIPVAQLAVQTRPGPAHHSYFGEALRPLRDQGVLIVGSGRVTHNLSEFGAHRYDSHPPAWVSAFNDWLAAGIESLDTPGLLDYRRRAPHAVRNHPSEEHLLPLYAA